MSTAFYKNDHTPLCVNHLDTSYLAEQNIFNGNFLNIFPEQSNEIYRKCFNYLATCQLSSRCVRVFCAIMEQTVGFHKLEDNLTSTRLEGLTKIRRDHAAQAMRELDQNNVIIHRHGGQYRNYVSINFNLESWGAGKNNTEARSNDPRRLISDTYEGKPIDEGLDLSSVNEQTISEADLNDVPIDQGYCLEDIPYNHLESLKNTPKIEPIQAKIAASKPVEVATDRPVEINTPTETEAPITDKQTLKSTQPIDDDTLTLKIQTVIASALNTIETKLSDQLSHQLQNVVGKLHTIEAKFQDVQDVQIQESKPQATENITPIANHTAQNQTHQTHQTQTPDAALTSVNPNPSIAYQFPTQLSDQQCQELERSLLPRAGDYSQALLETLTHRLQNSTDPLKNPLAYFSSLVSKLELGTLDLHAFSSNTERAAKQQAAQYDQLQQQIDYITQTYLAESAIYKPLHEQIETEVKKQGLDYWDAANKLQLSATVTPMIEKLNGLYAESERLEAEQDQLKKSITVVV